MSTCFTFLARPCAFTCTPAVGTVLGVGSQTLSATFTPNDSSTYTAATATVKIAVVYRSGGLCDGDVGHMILQPINADGTSVWKQGRTIPAKFRVCDMECLSAPQGSWQVSI